MNGLKMTISCYIWGEVDERLIGRQKQKDAEFEEQALSWIHERRDMRHVSRKLVMFKAKFTYDEKCENIEAMKDAFIAGNGWLVKLMSCKNLSLRMKTTKVQKDPPLLTLLTGTLAGYVMYP